jgi:hypothetical protein
MNITDHAKTRIKERCGLPKKALERNAAIAFEEGVRHGDCTGRLKKYIDFLFLSHGCGANIRIYGNHVYIFTQNSLVTVLPLPNIYRKAISKIMKRRNGDGRNDVKED